MAEDDTIYIDADDETYDETDALLSPSTRAPYPSESDGEGERERERARQRSALRPALTLLLLTAISFFTVSGGPFGLEVAVASGGPIRVISFMTLLTLVASLPQALMTAELSSALPGRTGFMLWVDRGLNAELGTLNGWFSLLNMMVDTAAYPGLCLDYLVFGMQRYAGWGALTAGWRYALKALIAASMCATNLAGITLAARTSVVLAVFTLAPFVIALVLALLSPRAALAGVGATLASGWSSSGTGDMGTMLVICVWCTSGFDSVSFMSGDAQGKRTVASAMKIGVVITLAATALPILVSCAALGADKGGAHWERWRLGSFTLVAERYGGPLLGIWTCAAGVTSSIGLLNVFMCTAARNMQAVARRGMLPSLLRRDSGVEATPRPALVFVTAMIWLLLALPFAKLIVIDMALFCASLVLRQLALIRLRVTEPRLHRPYKIPLGTCGLVLAFLPLFAINGLVIAASLRSLESLVAWAVTIGTGLALRRVGPRLFMPREGSPPGTPELSRLYALD